MIIDIDSMKLETKKILAAARLIIQAAHREQNIAHIAYTKTPPYPVDRDAHARYAYWSSATRRLECHELMASNYFYPHENYPEAILWAQEVLADEAVRKISHRALEDVEFGWREWEMTPPETWPAGREWLLT